MEKYKKNLVEILIEDKDFLVLNKPAGLVTHPDGRTEELSLSGWLINFFPEVRGVGEVLNFSDGRIIEKWGIVHRLDRETSGVIIVARTQRAFSFLKEQFKNREIRKKYNVFVSGELKKDEGKIDRPIGRSKNDQRRWSAERGARGTMREALTLYRVIWRGSGVSLLEVEPRTGRTHQIRVHFKAIGYPVVGDKLYAPNRPVALSFERTALHSRWIEAKNLKGEVFSAEASFPKDFVSAFRQLGIKFEKNKLMC